MKASFLCLAFLALLLTGCGTQPAEPALLPLPKTLVYASGAPRWTRVPEDPQVRLVAAIPEAEANPEEAYRISVTRAGIVIEAMTDAGVWDARQTLRQLRRADGCYPLCTITDWPAFRVRGWMLDTGRTFMSMEELYREIDHLSRFKLNVFHWHLTENQAWRLESRKYPQLNAAESMSRQPGCYYTLAEAQALDAYARERGVTVIPEFDMPGHSAAFERAMGFGMQTPEGKAVLRDLLDELCETFSGPWIHIGTDEVRFTDPTFAPEMAAHVRSRGKKVIAWNPGWPFQAGEVDMTQLWSYRGKATEGIPAIDCRLHYINHFDSYGDIVGLHTSRIYDQDCGSEAVAGSIIALWNDQYVEGDEQIVVQNALYPSALALADRAWRGGGYQYFDDFGVALPTEGPVYDDFADFEHRMLATAADLPLHYLPQSGLRWQIAGPFPNGGALTAVFPPEEAGYDWSDAPVAAGAGIYFRHTWGALVPAYFKDPQPDQTVYARTVIHAPKATEALLWFETQNHSRSELDTPAPEGRWDHRESWIRLNGVAVDPPAWTSLAGFPPQTPVRIRLQRGDNEILVKLPVGAFSTPETRLVKWMFTCQIQSL